MKIELTANTILAAARKVAEANGAISAIDVAAALLPTLVSQVAGVLDVSSHYRKDGCDGTFGNIYSRVKSK